MAPKFTVYGCPMMSIRIFTLRCVSGIDGKAALCPQFLRRMSLMVNSGVHCPGSYAGDSQYADADHGADGGNA